LVHAVREATHALQIGLLAAFALYALLRARARAGLARRDGRVAGLVAAHLAVAALGLTLVGRLRRRAPRAQRLDRPRGARAHLGRGEGDAYAHRVAHRAGVVLPAGEQV